MLQLLIALLQSRKVFCWWVVLYTFLNPCPFKAIAFIESILLYYSAKIILEPIGACVGISGPQAIPALGITTYSVIQVFSFQNLITLALIPNIVTLFRPVSEESQKKDLPYKDRITGWCKETFEFSLVSIIFQLLMTRFLKNGYAYTHVLFAALAALNSLAILFPHTDENPRDTERKLSGNEWRLYLLASIAPFVNSVVAINLIKPAYVSLKALSFARTLLKPAAALSFTIGICSYYPKASEEKSQGSALTA